jgi:hypothetical protein
MSNDINFSNLRPGSLYLKCYKWKQYEVEFPTNQMYKDETKTKSITQKDLRKYFN